MRLPQDWLPALKEPPGSPRHNSLHEAPSRRRAHCPEPDTVRDGGLTESRPRTGPPLDPESRPQASPSPGSPQTLSVGAQGLEPLDHILVALIWDLIFNLSNSGIKEKRPRQARPGFLAQAFGSLNKRKKSEKESQAAACGSVCPPRRPALHALPSLSLPLLSVALLMEAPHGVRIPKCHMNPVFGECLTPFVLL